MTGINKSKTFPSTTCTNGQLLMTYPQPFDIIEWHKWGRLLNHVAIVLDDPLGLLWVYEAFPPEIRRVPYSEHADMWLFRTSKRVVYRNANLMATQRLSMRVRLNDLLGEKYSWLPNIIGALPGFWHCIEYICEAQVAAWNSDIYPRDLSRVGPVLWRQTTIELGWEIYPPQA